MNCGEDAMTLRSDVAVHKTEAKISQRSIAQFKAMTPVVLPQNDVLFKQLRLCIPRCVAIGIPTKNQEGRSFHVDMENLLNQFRKPAIMDMKMGIRMYADNATPQKRLRMMQKAAVTVVLLIFAPTIDASACTAYRLVLGVNVVKIWASIDGMEGMLFV